jgi:hypothetical protein
MGWTFKELTDSWHIYLFSKVSGSAKGAHQASYAMGPWSKVMVYEADHSSSPTGD